MLKRKIKISLLLTGIIFAGVFGTLIFIDHNSADAAVEYTLSVEIEYDSYAGGNIMNEVRDGVIMVDSEIISSLDENFTLSVEAGDYRFISWNDTNGNSFQDPGEPSFEDDISIKGHTNIKIVLNETAIEISGTVTFDEYIQGPIKIYILDNPQTQMLGSMTMSSPGTYSLIVSNAYAGDMQLIIFNDYTDNDSIDTSDSVSVGTATINSDTTYDVTLTPPDPYYTITGTVSYDDWESGNMIVWILRDIEENWDPIHILSLNSPGAFTLLLPVADADGFYVAALNDVDGSIDFDLGTEAYYFDLTTRSVTGDTTIDIELTMAGGPVGYTISGTVTQDTWEEGYINIWVTDAPLGSDGVTFFQIINIEDGPGDYSIVLRDGAEGELYFFAWNDVDGDGGPTPGYSEEELSHYTLLNVNSDLTYDFELKPFGYSGGHEVSGTVTYDDWEEGDIIIYVSANDIFDLEDDEGPELTGGVIIENPGDYSFELFPDYSGELYIIAWNDVNGDGNFDIDITDEAYYYSEIEVLGDITHNVTLEPLFIPTISGHVKQDDTGIENVEIHIYSDMNSNQALDDTDVLETILQTNSEGYYEILTIDFDSDDILIILQPASLNLPSDYTLADGYSNPRSINVGDEDITADFIYTSGSAPVINENTNINADTNTNTRPYTYVNYNTNTPTGGTNENINVNANTSPDGNSNTNTNINSIIINNKNLGGEGEDLPTIEQPTGENLVLEGKTTPNTRVVITIVTEDGEEIQIETISDSEGNWKIIFDKSKLPEGDHTIYIQTEIDGQLSEMVELAKLVISGKTKLSATWLVVIIIAVVVIIGILLSLLLFIKKKRKTQK